MSNHDRYTPEQRAKIRMLENTFNRWESEEGYHQRIVDRHELDRAEAERQRKAAETKLVNFLLQCDAELENQ